MKICQASELARQYVQTFKEPSLRAAYQDAEAVNALTLKGKPQGKFKNNDSKIKTTDKEMFTYKRCGEKNTDQDNVLVCGKMGKYVQNVRDKIIRLECLEEKKKEESVHTVQEDSDDGDDLSDTFFIKMVSHDEDNGTLQK